MKIQYDKDFEKVMNELQANFGWSNIDALPDSYKDLLNDTIKAVKNCSIPAVSHRLLRELRQTYLVNVDNDGHPKASITEIMDLWDRVNRELQIVTID